MGRWIDYNPSQKAVTATSTNPVVFQANDIPGSARGVGNLVGLSFSTEYVTAGTNIVISKLSRIKIKASGNLLWDIGGTQFRAFYGRFAPANLIYGNSSAAFTVWFNAFDMDDDDQADQCGFPYNTVPTAEITFDGTQGAGSMKVGYIFSDVEASRYATLIGQPMGVAASQNQMGYPLNESGEIRGMGLTSTGLNKARLVLGGRQWINAEGPATATAANTLGDMLRETQQIELDQALVSDTFYRLPNVQAPQGSRIELTTGTAWAGVNNEIAFWALHDQAA